MLVLLRKPGEAVRIGDSRVVVLKSARRGATLGIDASPDTEVMRAEVEQEAPAAGTAVIGSDTESRGMDGRESVRDGLARDVTTNADGSDLARRRHATDGSGSESRR